MNVIQYVTIDTTGNATDFGDLPVARYGLGSNGNGDRATFAGGYIDGNSYITDIEYVIIRTTGIAFDFGDLSLARRSMASSSGD